jgi:hypothetical protein
MGASRAVFERFAAPAESMKRAFSPFRYVQMLTRAMPWAGIERAFGAGAEKQIP